MLTLDRIIRRHDLFEFAFISRGNGEERDGGRMPGHETTSCLGRVRRVDGATRPIPEDSPPAYDSAQRDEGEPDQSVEVYLYGCAACGVTLVVARSPDGRLRLRNAVEWEPADPGDESLNLDFPARSECRCPCHDDIRIAGAGAVHAMPCCRPDPAPIASIA